MRIWSRAERQKQRSRRLGKPRHEALESRDLLCNMGSPMPGDMGFAMALVDDCNATAHAVQNGAWSDPATWLEGVVPATNANVDIPTGVSVTLDTASNPLHWLSVCGTLQFATDRDTSLSLDTLVVCPGGSLIIGTAANPVAAPNQATITITSNGAIDPAWDPHSLSRGLISMGTVSMYGTATTPYVTLTGNAAQGATTLTLSQVPTNWNAGDEIVLGGTYSKWNQDEDLHILNIQGNQVPV